MGFLSRQHFWNKPIPGLGWMDTVLDWTGAVGKKSARKGVRALRTTGNYIAIGIAGLAAAIVLPSVVESLRSPRRFDPGPEPSGDAVPPLMDVTFRATPEPGTLMGMEPVEGGFVHKLHNQRDTTAAPQIPLAYPK